MNRSNPDPISTGNAIQSDQSVVRRPNPEIDPISWANQIGIAKPNEVSKSLGLGDAVAAMTKSAGLKETTGCGCARRRATLNRWTPVWLSQLLGRLARVGSRPGR